MNRVFQFDFDNCTLQRVEFLLKASPTWYRTLYSEYEANGQSMAPLEQFVLDNAQVSNRAVFSFY